jgi:recombination protein RecA
MALRSFAPEVVADIPVFRARDLRPAGDVASWRMDSLIGFLAEISEETACGAVSFAADLIAEAQNAKEPVAWVASQESIFFPPDLAARGVDLSAVAVIRTGTAADAFTAAEWLVRSWAIGLVIVDLEANTILTDAELGRLQKLAERNGTAVLFLTRKRATAPSLGSRICLRGAVARTHGTGYSIVVTSVRDKRSNGGSRQSRQYDGPPGLR